MCKLTKLGSYLLNTNIWVIFGQKSGFWPPGVLICMVTPPLFCDSFWRNTIICCPKCIFVATLYHRMGQIGELFECYLYLRSFLVKIWEFDPLGGQYRRSLPTGLQLILKKYHNVLSWMYFVVTLYYPMGQIGKLFEYYLYLGSFLV